MRASFTMLLLALAACGGRIDTSSEAPPTASGTNNPSSATGADGCVRACERMTTSCDAMDDENGACVRSCRSDLGGDPEAERRYAACLEALSCEDIRRGMSMDYGPIGECWTRARRGP